MARPGQYDYISQTKDIYIYLIWSHWTSVTFCVLIMASIVCLLAEVSTKRMGGGGGYTRKNQSVSVMSLYVGSHHLTKYLFRRDDPDRPWESSCRRRLELKEYQPRRGITICKNIICHQGKAREEGGCQLYAGTDLVNCLPANYASENWVRGAVSCVLLRSWRRKTNKWKIRPPVTSRREKQITNLLVLKCWETKDGKEMLK